MPGTRASILARGSRAAPCTSGRPGSPAAVERDSSRLPLLRDTIAEPRERTAVLSPVRKHLDPEVEVDLLLDQRLDLHAGRPPDLLDPRALGADQDVLLCLALYVENGTNIDRGARLAKLLDFACEAVGDLLVELLERRFPHELRGEEAKRLRADIICVVQER